MTFSIPYYSKEEVVERGHQLYDAQIRTQVETDNHGKIVAIDLVTGDFDIAEDSLTSAKKLLLRNPSAQVFCIRIGHRAVHRLGFHGFRVSV
jgi:hypothetical protein